MNPIETALFWLKVKFLWPIAYRMRKVLSSGFDRSVGSKGAYDFSLAGTYWQNVPRAQGGSPWHTESLQEVSDKELEKMFDREVKIAKKKKERRVGFDLAWDAISPLREPRILDYGSGIGFYGFEILSRHAGARVIFADIAAKNLEAIKRIARMKGFLERFECVLVQDEKARGLEFECPFDLIVSMGVLHHTPYAAQIVQNLSLFLKPGGIFEVMLYNHQYLKAMEVVVGKPLSASEFGEMTDPGQGGCQNPYSEAYDCEKTCKLFRGYELVSLDCTHPFYDTYRFRKPAV